MNIKRSSEISWNDNGKTIYTDEFVNQYCPDKEFVEWYNNGGKFILVNYAMEAIEHNNYGWEDVYETYKVPGDMKTVEAWDKANQVFLF